ncbi:MAG: lipopolysaccharide assembly protein LapA domain-containing protein [Spirochaetales bacterium]|nr:lipopolysaccharide assembly protein LapA domain-containing protein [Spirochaetales bacterium]
MRIVYIIFLLVVAVLAVIFAVQNSTVVTLTFFGWAGQASLSLLLILALAAGILTGMVIMTPTLLRKHRELARTRKELGKQAQESIPTQGATTPSDANAEANSSR